MELESGGWSRRKLGGVEDGVGRWSRGVGGWSRRMKLEGGVLGESGWSQKVE